MKRPRRPAPSEAIARSVALSAAFTKLACSAPAAPVESPPASSSTAAPLAATAPSAPVTATADPLPPPAPDPSPALSVYTVTNASFARRKLYTWTTADQIHELLRTTTLLSRTESPRYGRSFYDRKMDEQWLAGDKLAGLLRAPAFLKARFAWPAPWATLLGWPGEKYGTDLIEVTLKKEAWIAMFRTATRTWDVRDLEGAALTIGDVLQHPERLAAVHFVHDNVMPPPTTSSPPTIRASMGDGREAYREYVLCNESMIESWSVATDRIQAELSASADTVEAAAKHFAAHPPQPQRADRWNAHVALLVWPGLVPRAAPKELYEAALAFPNPNYVIDPEALKRLAAQLRALPQHGTSTTHRPIAAFPGAKPVPIPPPPPPPRPQKRVPWRGTF